MTAELSAEDAIRAVVARIDAAWRHKQFEGLEACFHPAAVIMGPGYVELARGGEKCAESYREFATNAAVLEYSESGHALRIWANTAVYTFSWQMTYQRDGGPKRESGSDQLVFSLEDGRWQVVWRHVFFESV